MFRHHEVAAPGAHFGQQLRKHPVRSPRNRIRMVRLRVRIADKNQLAQRAARTCLSQNSRTGPASSASFAIGSAIQFDKEPISSRRSQTVQDWVRRREDHFWPRRDDNRTRRLRADRWPGHRHNEFY